MIARGNRIGACGHGARAFRATSALGALALAACGAVQRPDGGEGPLGVGDAAPDLRGVDHRARPVALRALEGRYLIVYFYPKDGTPGCTTEACAFRDAWARYEAASVEVIGVSSDSVESHRQFAAEHELPFGLVSDPENEWSQAFGVGTFLGMTERVTFLIGPDGRVRKVYDDVDPALHAEQILRDIGRSSR